MSTQNQLGVTLRTIRSRRTDLLNRAWLLAAAGFVAMAVIACGSDVASAPIGPVTSGDSPGNAPQVSGNTFSHGAFSLDMYPDQPVLVNFWFPSCPQCRSELPTLQAAHEKYGDQVAFIGVMQLGLESAAEGKAFLEQLGVSYPAMPDESVSIQVGYEIFLFPTTVFLDRNHNIATRWTGIIGKNQLEQQLAALVAG